MRTALELFRRLVSLVPHMPEELETAAINATDARQLAYLIAASVRMEPVQAQEILETRPGQREAGATQPVPEQGAGGARTGPQDSDRRPRTR